MGLASPVQPSDGMILGIGPHLEGHSVIFFAIQTHSSHRFHLAVDSLGLRRRRSSPQFIDPPQDFSKQVPGHGDFGQMERDVATVAHDLGPDLDQHLWQRGQRPVFHFFRQSESQDLMLWTAPATGVAMCHSAAALRSGQSPFMAQAG